ncbi:MAG: polyprenyl diphosphate synthase [Roseburia sp.]|nr:polyprenyl diphosphate synthase [Roseburia sp.]
MEEIKIVPETVGLIMDGNGRWAKKNGKRRMEGHTKGILNMISLCSHAFDRGVKNMVCYGLSTENLKRPVQEVEHIYKLVVGAFDLFVTTFTKQQACVKYIGNTDILPAEVCASMERCEKELSKFRNSGRTIYIGIAYGSRHEMVSAINRAVERGEKVTEEKFLSMLGMPLEPQLIIRTGGEKRLSNFLLYQASYSELYFSDKMFPDFGDADFDQALSWYAERNRRYGLV